MKSWIMFNNDTFTRFSEEHELGGSKMTVEHTKLRPIVPASDESYLALNEVRTIEAATIEKCVAWLQSQYMGDNNREDMEVRRLVKAMRKHFGLAPVVVGDVCS